MPQDSLYGIALIAIAACLLLIYFVIGWSPRDIAPPPPRDVAPQPPRRYAPRPRRRFYAPYRVGRRPASTPAIANQQLNAVMEASFTSRRLLSDREYRAFKIIEDDIGAVRRGYRVFAQTNLGEILDSPSEDAFRSINSKRVDILIVDRGGRPIVAVEYQGTGHYQGNAVVRDAVKKEALTKAGVAYVEIFPSDSPDQIRARVREQLGLNTSVPSTSGARNSMS